MTDTQSKNYILQHFIGYSAGIALFLFIIPLVLWFVAISGWPIFNMQFIPSGYLPIILAIPIGCFGGVFIIWSNFLLFFQGKGGPTNLGDIKLSPETKKLVKGSKGVKSFVVARTVLALLRQPFG